VKILVTTNLKETYGKEEEILFAGDWMKSSLDFEKDFQKRKYKFFESIWKDETEIRNFIPYLTDLRSRLLNKLAIDLNAIHNTNYSLRSWEIMINPWLHYYLEGMYTRFETINKILNKKENLNFIYLNNLKFLETPFDVRDFTDYIRSSDIYNQFIFQKIIDFFKNIKKNEYLKLIYSNEKISKKENLNFLKIYKNQKYEKQSYVRRFISFCLKSLTRNNKFFLELNSLGFNFILLSLKLKQIPFKDYEFFTYKKYYQLFKNKSITSPELRNKIFFEFNKQNDFENFLSRNFFIDIPKFLIEDFSAIKNFVEKIPYKSKIIVSDTRHEHDTIFKFWVANSVKKGSKLITSDHGGAYGGLHCIRSIMHEDIADVAVRWFKPIKNNNVQLPVLQLLNTKRKKNKNKRKYLLTISDGATKYLKSVFLSSVYVRMLYQTEYLSSLYENLDSELKDNFLFKSNPSDEWNVEKRLENIFQKKRIISSKKKYWNYFNKSKIVVCTYFSTSFCEAMISGPTILLFKPGVHKNREEFEPLHENLKKVKILFEDPILASKHLNKIWKNVDNWWESGDVKIARENFVKKVALVEPNPFEKWKKFLHNL